MKVSQHIQLLTGRAFAPLAVSVLVLASGPSFADYEWQDRRGSTADVQRNGHAGSATFVQNANRASLNGNHSAHVVTLEVDDNTEQPVPEFNEAPPGTESGDIDIAFRLNDEEKTVYYHTVSDDTWHTAPYDTFRAENYFRAITLSKTLPDTDGYRRFGFASDVNVIASFDGRANNVTAGMASSSLSASVDYSSTPGVDCVLSSVETIFGSGADDDGTVAERLLDFDTDQCPSVDAFSIDGWRLRYGFRSQSFVATSSGDGDETSLQGTPVSYVRAQIKPLIEIVGNGGQVERRPLSDNPGNNCLGINVQCTDYRDNRTSSPLPLSIHYAWDTTVRFKGAVIDYSTFRSEQLFALNMLQTHAAVAGAQAPVFSEPSIGSSHTLIMRPTNMGAGYAIDVTQEGQSQIIDFIQAGYPLFQNKHYGYLLFGEPVADGTNLHLLKDLTGNIEFLAKIPLEVEAVTWYQIIKPKPDEEEES